MVKKYKTFFKLLLRMISHSKARFFSILIISLIGAAFFGGMRVTPTVFKLSTDTYLDMQNYADLTLITTYGVTSEDLTALKNIDGVENVEGLYCFDAQLNNGKAHDGVTVYSYSKNFNLPTITQGRAIENEKECLMDEQYGIANEYHIGDKITLENDNGKETFEIVGLVKDVRYILYHSRGSNQYGNKISQGFIIADKESVRPLALAQDLIDLFETEEIYNQAVIDVARTDAMTVFHDDYEKHINDVQDDIEEVMNGRLEQSYQSVVSDKKALLADQTKEYNDGMKAYEENEKQLTTLKNSPMVPPEYIQQMQEELDKAKKELDEAKLQLDAAQNDIDSIPEAELFMIDEDMNEGLVSVQNDAERLSTIGKIFPLMFFLVAALVCLTTMTRLVEEMRSQSGTLRALGYGRALIIVQYAVYALIPTLAGSIIGFFIGSFIFPYAVYKIYTLILYDVPIDMVYHIDTSLLVLSVCTMVLITVCATLFSCIKEILNVPSVLMRPKAPKEGKRIFLERITPIWMRLSFNQKVTMRNIFRYKKRFFMSVVGIAGCAGLILTGFGLRYSITDMTVKQFEEVILYDGSISYTQNHTLDNIEEWKTLLEKEPHISQYLYVSQQNVSALNLQKDSIDAVLFVPESVAELDQFVHLRECTTDDALALDEEGAIITQKMAELLSVQEGDSIQFTYDNKQYEAKISNITENYIGHTIYISPDYAKKVMDVEVPINSAVFSTDSLDDSVKDNIRNNLLNCEDISSVTFVQESAETIVNQLDSIGIITWILITSAAMLAFVVLYNLTNININERKTEIATIKVLGFRKKEVYDYVFRENILLSIIGALFGLLFGFYLHHTIITTVEIDFIMFVRTIKPISYIFAIVLTMLFAMLVNRFMRLHLNRIDMITSLKSVE